MKVRLMGVFSNFTYRVSFPYLREQATWHFPIAERNHEQRPALPDDGAPLTTRAGARSSPEDRLGLEDGGDDLGHAEDDAGASLCPRAPMSAHMPTPTGFSRCWQER